MQDFLKSVSSHPIPLSFAALPLTLPLSRSAPRKCDLADHCLTRSYITRHSFSPKPSRRLSIRVGSTTLRYESRIRGRIAAAKSTTLLSLRFQLFLFGTSPSLARLPRINSIKGLALPDGR